MTLFAILLCLAVLALAVAVGIMLRLVLRLQTAAAAPRSLGDADLEALGQRVAETLGASPDSRLDALATRIDRLHAEFDWVVGESVIQSAVALARMGEPAAEMPERTGAEDTAMSRRQRRH
ncbi:MULTISPECIES: hypothetical protein [Roseicyclus]|uniref:hypothetical protein n=1 Tax=Roseicyclus amphidinii TaxID=3034232 RepID=UPI0024E0DF39|nr:hypothetical protein [Roseicyclus sp. Amp-Y-6]